MIALKDHFHSIKRALFLISKGHFLLFFIPGLVVSLVFYTIVFAFEGLSSFIGLISYTPWVGAFLGTTVDSVFSYVNSISIFIYQFTIITLLSPFHTMLSQRVETLETGKQFPTNWTKFLKDILRTLGVVIVGGTIYFTIYLFWTLFAWLFSISYLSPFVSVILIGFFTGFNSYDYSLERHGVSIVKSWVYAFKHPLQMLFTGAIFTLFFYIPFIGVVIAPVLLTMVGTINYLRMEERKKHKIPSRNTFP